MHKTGLSQILSQMSLFFCFHQLFVREPLMSESKNLLSPSLRSVPVAPSATPDVPAAAAAESSVSGPARLSMLLAADRQDGVEAGEMTEELTTVA